MSWRKFCLNIMGQDEKTNKFEIDTDDEVTESDETVSTEKSSRNIGTSHKLFYKWLPEGCLKFFFLLLNSVALLAGVTAITMSVLMLTDTNFTSRLVGQRLSMTILLILGVFVSFVAFTGIIAIAKKKEHFMIFYVICQSVALCAVFVSLTLSFPFFDKITKNIRNDMIDSMKSYHSLDWAPKAWDNTHKYLNCCGIRSSKDWLDYQMDIPRSCCATVIKQCLHMTEDVSYKSGCLRGAIELLKSYVQTASISTLVIFPLLLISVFLALGLRKGLKMNRLTRDEATY
ncbi:tetraspanin-9 [Solenopsis invicta]|uniref:tetraspanin-9 n=1 Tax=Solenopsis invicta TaxID=13686 RepID=UPI000E33F54C|nr:tetraspanin-9 [Solenopsis invicta]